VSPCGQVTLARDNVGAGTRYRTIIELDVSGEVRNGPNLTGTPRQYTQTYIAEPRQTTPTTPPRQAAPRFIGPVVGPVQVDTIKTRVESACGCSNSA
jgi:hypothetical protein